MVNPIDGAKEATRMGELQSNWNNKTIKLTGRNTVHENQVQILKQRNFTFSHT